MLPAGACWEVQRENQTVTALRGITSHSWTVCFGPSFLSGTQTPKEAQPGVWDAAAISSLHLLADVGAEGDMRPLRGAVPHCKPEPDPGSSAQGSQGVCTSSFCAERELSAYFKQQLPTSGASVGQEPAQPPAGAGNWNWGGSEPQARSSCGKGSLGEPGERTGACKQPVLTLAQSLSCWAPSSPVPTVLAAREDFLPAQSQNKALGTGSCWANPTRKAQLLLSLSCPVPPWWPLPALLVCGTAASKLSQPRARGACSEFL